MINTVVLVFYIVGTPIEHPAYLIEVFATRKACEHYKREAGWSMVRSTIGLNISPDPVPGIVMVCSKRL